MTYAGYVLLRTRTWSHAGLGSLYRASVVDSSSGLERQGVGRFVSGMGTISEQAWRIDVYLYGWIHEGMAAKGRIGCPSSELQNSPVDGDGLAGSA